MKAVNDYTEKDELQNNYAERTGPKISIYVCVCVCVCVYVYILYSPIY